MGSAISDLSFGFWSILCISKLAFCVSAGSAHSATSGGAAALPANSKSACCSRLKTHPPNPLLFGREGGWKEIIGFFHSPSLSGAVDFLENGDGGSNSKSETRNPKQIRNAWRRVGNKSDILSL
jgi:hypothetical protein